ncbi:ATP-binding protein [Alcaligenes sp. DN25]|uniref:ATP-binding protein n=1 Tax=Alcaligenes TaxID=507 RepID=UPI00202E8CDA|nr:MULTISPECIES: ATP-binding protein [Alcaligenes]URW83062.1 ATP-binding protein [Alcaligenes sp. DN25]WEA67893.1 ATP-binding protein [Alcaligenes faecalis]
MNTIRLQTNQHRLIANLRHAFTVHSMLGELLQNARRAQARHISVTAEGDTLTVSDDGTGIADLQTLIYIAESGWDEDLIARENAFGLGVLSTLYFAQHLSVHSRAQAFNAATATIIRGDGIEVRQVSPRAGTEIRLDGVQLPQSGRTLIEWAERELARLCEAFPVPVSFNDIEIVRPLAGPDLPWRQTAMGRVLLDLSAPSTQWRYFLQGLPVGREPLYGKYQVVLLPDDTLARLPDRQHLLNESDDHKLIQAAIDQAYREGLIEAKAQLAASEFVEHYAQSCLNSSNADLLNDVPFVPRSWFRNWEHEPSGFHWAHYSVGGLVAREVLEQLGVWTISTDEDDAHTVEVYLEAAKAFLLQEPGLDDGHWLKTLVRTVTPEQIQVRSGATLHRDSSRCLADDEVDLELVESLHVGLEGELEHAVQAVRKGNTLYLTPEAGGRTEFISDYIFDDRYDEDREYEDAQAILTFIAVGCSDAPDRVLAALLPGFLRHTAQPKLANATVCLSFDAEGKLHAIA